eukprot:Mycagemm_TRINITY_DN10239_c0_g1::TRINITY_DN10239_c0_g1_i2::g.4128::m.4128 type:complete len:118 gc:universal TRINITY_DN10239_c0_g1_i2:368-15(-)
MENQFEQNRNFNQSHRGQSTVTNTQSNEKGQPQGEEGNPNQRLAKREALDGEEKALDRRPADVAQGIANDQGDQDSSAVAGIQNDQQNASEGASEPLGEDPNHNAEIENKEDAEETK